MFSSLVSRFSRLFRCFRPPRRSHSNRPRRSHSNRRHRSQGTHRRTNTAAFVIVYGRNSTILCLIGRNGKYELPGGSVKVNESTRSGAQRELREETSIIADLRNINHIYRRSSRYGSTDLFTYNYSGNRVIISREHTGYCWMNINWIRNNKNAFTNYHQGNINKVL